MSRVADIQAGRERPLDPAFGEYVAGRTIACVAPGPITPDEYQQIAEHDLIYIVAGQTFHHDVTPNIVFLNRHGVGRMLKGFQQYDGFDWVVTKSAPHNIPRTRKARFSLGKNLNQLPIAVEDLTHFQPADVSVYGADLYLGGPGKAYLNIYDNRQADAQYRGVIGHTPTMQHEHLRDIWQRTGWFSRSDRFRSVLEMDTDVYYRELRARWVPAVGAAA